MARPKKPVHERIDRLTQQHDGHLLWKGQMRRGKPHLDRVGNPVRVLLGLADHPTIQVRPCCPEKHPNCINPHHWRVIVEKSRIYDDAPPPNWSDPRSGFSNRDLIEIEENLELLQNNEITVEDLDMLPAHIKAEILVRGSGPL